MSQQPIRQGYLRGAAAALTGELSLELLLPKLARLCAEAARAERTALILDGDTGLVVRSDSSFQDEPLEQTPLGASTRLPVALIEQVFHSGDRALTGDAAREQPFAGDPYLVAQRVSSLLAIPIRRAERIIGVLYFENGLDPHAFGSERLPLLELLSSQLAVAIANSVLFEERERSESDARFLSEVSKTLAESLDYQATLTRVAQLAVPRLADWCLVDVVEKDSIRRVAGTHVAPEKKALLRRLEVEHPLSPGSQQPAAIALRSGVPYVRSLDATVVEQHTSGAEHFRIIRALGSRGVMSIPLIAHGRTVGVITFISARESLVFGVKEIALGEEIARRAALAIENARLYLQAQDSIRLRDEFLAAASHELRTPVTSLLLSIQALLVDEGQLPERAQRAARLADRQAIRLAKLVNDMMSVGRIHLERIRLDLDDVDLVALVRDVTERMATLLAKAGCSLEVRAPESLRGWWDRGQLEQVLTNLLANAMKFGAGRPIEIVVEACGEQARLQVVDHGIGISAALLSRVFEKFERAAEAHSYGGLGLGLFIASNVVKALGGTVFAESEPGVATRFTVELPLLGPKPE